VSLALAVLAGRGSDPAFGQAPSGVIYSRDRSFRIPYKVDPVQQSRLKEVQLHVSTDRGGTWRHYTSGPPASEFFTFTSQSDGEHWFAVRTVDFEGRFDPPTLTGAAPGLVVAVDTTAPHVELRGLSLPGDEAGVEWNLHDENLDLSTLRVEFRVGGSDWFPIRVDAARSGQSKFRPGVRGQMEIRLRVLDKAGNEGLQQIVLAPTGGASGPPLTAGATPAFQASAAGPTSPAYSPTDFGVPPPPNFHSTFEPAPGAPASTPIHPTAPGAPQTGRLVPPGTSAAPAAPTANLPRTPAQLVNSLRFEINYEVDEVGKSGVSSVALFWTYDGAVWNYHGDDEDRRSPFLVEVDGEGVFGFKLIARSGAGLGEDPPRPGDPADVWVEVDITPPKIDLPPPQPGRGPSNGLLDIEWRMTEKNPAAKPITLLYSETASGPWIPIAENLENTGRYQWRMPTDESFPYKFFVRIEGRDRAGNVGRAETPTPVVVDLIKPRLRIVRVEPSGRPESELAPAASRDSRVDSDGKADPAPAAGKQTNAEPPGDPVLSPPPLEWE
jgi:hypothetical protein